MHSSVILSVWINSPKQRGSKRKFKRPSCSTTKSYSETSGTSNIIPLPRHSQNTIGHRDQG